MSELFTALKYRWEMLCSSFSTAMLYGPIYCQWAIFQLFLIWTFVVVNVLFRMLVLPGPSLNLLSWTTWFLACEVVGAPWCPWAPLVSAEVPMPVAAALWDLQRQSGAHLGWVSVWTFLALRLRIAFCWNCNPHCFPATCSNQPLALFEGRLHHRPLFPRPWRHFWVLADFPVRERRATQKSELCPFLPLALRCSLLIHCVSTGHCVGLG